MLAALLSSRAPAQEAADAKPLDGLRVMVCVPYWDTYSLPAVRKLQAAGAEVRTGNLGSLTWAQAQKFHLIVAETDRKPKTPPAAGPDDALRRFVEAGGGLLYINSMNHGEQADNDYYLGPFGASILYELILDPPNTYRKPTVYRIDYACTTHILAGHPVTEGVERIWYYAGAQRHGFPSSPLRLSGDWTALVHAEASAHSVRTTGVYDNEEHSTGTFATAPPLIAARVWGAGRIVLVGIVNMEFFSGQDLPAYQDVLMRRGDGFRPGDTGRLYWNAVRWLADGSRAATGLGQGELDPVRNAWADVDAPDWTAPAAKPAVDPPALKGVIGVHSDLSDGRAPPLEYVRAAAAAGLQWIAFTERFEALTPAKWDELRRICREAGPDLPAAIPGLDYADATGDRYVILGDFAWPRANMLSEDGKRIVKPQIMFETGNAPLGPYIPDRAAKKLRPWGHSLYKLWPVRTTVGGKSEEAFDGYRCVQAMQDDPMPMAVDMVYDPDELRAAAGRLCTYLRRRDTAKLEEALRKMGGSEVYVSDGPVLTAWGGINAARRTGGQWYVAGSERYRLWLGWRSEAPVADVRIYDGEDLFLRFKPEPQATNVVFDVPHDKQRMLFAEIVDVNGRRAVTGAMITRDQLNWRFMCGDRGNCICNAVLTDSNGPFLHGPSATYQRKGDAFGIIVPRGCRAFFNNPPHFDGGSRFVGFTVAPSVTSPDFQLCPPGGRLEARNEQPVSSKDGILMADTITGSLPGTETLWATKYVPQDIRDVTIHYRYLQITPRPGDPGVTLLEGAVTFNKAMQVTALGLGGIGHKCEPGFGDLYALVTPSLRVSGVAGARRYAATARLTPGSYVVLHPSLWGSAGIIALDDGFDASLDVTGNRADVGLLAAGFPARVEAGQTFRYRFVLMNGRAEEPSNTADWERFVAAMGFTGPPAYEVKNIGCGRVASTAFLLQLEPDPDGGFQGTVTQATLPIRLPVRVANMNPNWTFAWFDLDRQTWFPSAVDQRIGQGYFTLDTRAGEHRIFAGHPVTADQPDLRIISLSDGRHRVRAALNNTGDDPVTAQVRLHPALGRADPQTVTLASGEMKEILFDGKTAD